MTQLKEGGRLVGYARVSTDDQNLDLQLDALRDAGCEQIYQEHVSGAAKRRPQLDLALMDLREGDTLIVWRLDRLARSLRDLTRRLEVIERKGAGFKSLTESLDMTTAGGRLILHIMGAIAEFERQLIAQRTSAGMQAKIARGWRPGRKPKLDADMLAEAQELRNAGRSATEIKRQIAKRYGVCVSKQTIYNQTVGPLSGDRK